MGTKGTFPAVKRPEHKGDHLLHLVKGKKVTWSRYRPAVAQRVGRGTALLFHDRGTRRGWAGSSMPRPHFTPGKTRYPFYRRLGWPQGRSGQAENLVPTGIRSRTFQPLVSRYTDWATGPTLHLVPILKMSGIVFPLSHKPSWPAQG